MHVMHDAGAHASQCTLHLPVSHLQTCLNKADNFVSVFSLELIAMNLLSYIGSHCITAVLMLASALQLIEMHHRLDLTGGVLPQLWALSIPLAPP